MEVSRRALDELRTKYEEMLRLRVEHARGDERDPRRDMAALAARFPGALREIDDLTLDEIRARLRALADSLRDPVTAPPAPWMIAIAMFHAMTRGALAAKRWLAGRKNVDPSMRDAFTRDATELACAEDAREWADDLHRVALPPRGRVTELVYERIARALAVTETEARLLVFGVSRRERRRTAKA